MITSGQFVKNSRGKLGIVTSDVNTKGFIAVMWEGGNYPVRELPADVTVVLVGALKAAIK